MTLNQTGGSDDGDAAISLDGSSAGNYVEVVSATDEVSRDSSTRDDRSFFVAFKVDTLSADQLIYQNGGTASAGFALYIYGSDSDLYLNYWQSANVHYNNASALTAGTWHTVTCVQDDANDNFHVYVDGSLSFTVDISGLASAANNPAFVCVGAARGSQSGSRSVRIHTGTTWSSTVSEFDGLIGEVAYASNVVLTSTEVQELHDAWAGTAGNSTNLASESGTDASTVTEKSAPNQVATYLGGLDASVVSLKGGINRAFYRTGADFSVEHTSGVESSAVSTHEGGASGTVVDNKGALQNVAHDGAADPSNISTKAASSTGTHEEEADISGTSTSAAFVSVVSTYEAGADYSVTGSKGAQVEIRWDADSVSSTTDLSARVTLIGHEGASTGAVITITARDAQLSHEIGALYSALQDELSTPACITLSVEHLYKIGISAEHLHKINLTITKVG